MGEPLSDIKRREFLIFFPKNICILKRNMQGRIMCINTNEFSICFDVNIYIPFEWWMQKILSPMLDSHNFSSADLDKLSNSSWLHLMIWSDITDLLLIIPYSPGPGCLYFIVLHSTKWNSSCTLLILSAIIYIAGNLCIFFKEHLMNWPFENN